MKFIIALILIIAVVAASAKKAPVKQPKKNWSGNDWGNYNNNQGYGSYGGDEGYKQVFQKYKICTYANSDTSCNYPESCFIVFGSECFNLPNGNSAKLSASNPGVTLDYYANLDCTDLTGTAAFRVTGFTDSTTGGQAIPFGCSTLTIDVTVPGGTQTELLNVNVATLASFSK